jgi:hypothetical protein
MTHEPTELVLLRAGHVQAWQVQRAQAHQRRAGGTVVEALVALGYVAERTVLAEVAQQLGVPYRDLSHVYVPPEIVALVPERLIRTRKVFPIDVAAESRRGPLIIATAAPHDLTVLDEVAFASELKVRAVLASTNDIEHAIERHLGAAAKRAVPLVAEPTRARQPAGAPARAGASAAWRGGPVTSIAAAPAPAVPYDWTTLRWTA